PIELCGFAPDTDRRMTTHATACTPPRARPRSWNRAPERAWPAPANATWESASCARRTVRAACRAALLSRAALRGELVSSRAPSLEQHRESRRRRDQRVYL